MRNLWATFLLVPQLAAWAAEPMVIGTLSDPWKGKSGNEIVSLLGEPEKKATSANGEETWTYRLFRVEPADLTDPTLTLLDVPGVGVVGQRRHEAPASTGTVTVEPTMIDEDGHPTGGLTTSESRSVSWSQDGGKVVTPEDPPRAQPRKVKLTFRLDAGGRVVSWSALPKEGGPKSAGAKSG